jgi:hypothetical protein
MRIERGQIVAFFAFDVGYAIALDQLRTLCAATPVQPLSGKKRTPSYLQYTRAPQTLRLGDAAPFAGMNGSIYATAFDFGAVSLSWRWTLPREGISIENLAAVAENAYTLGLEALAREHINLLFEKIKPAISRPRVSRFVEDYFLFVIEKSDQPMSAEDLLRQYASELAHTLRFERRQLSSEQIREALSQTVSYYEDDLVVIDWNAAIIYDTDYEDTAIVLELLNVALLEARFTDAELDQRISEYGKLVAPRREWPIPLRMPYRKPFEELAELRVDSSLLFERIENSLKLVGDLYLARVHQVAARRLHLAEWESTIAQKVEIVGDFYDVMTERVRASQSQLLELAIILLIVVEIVQSFF